MDNQYNDCGDDCNWAVIPVAVGWSTLRKKMEGTT